MSSLEDKIRVLCAQVVTEPQGPGLDAAIAELQQALREHYKEVRSLLTLYPPNPPADLKKRQLGKATGLHQIELGSKPASKP